jgi:ATP-binding cassette subfamily F protein 3
MFQVKDLCIAFSGNVLLEDATFSLQKGERCGLVGRNGSGKTTLLRLLTKQEVPDSGDIAIPRNYTVGYLDQHIRFTQPTVLEEGVLGLRPDERDQIYQVEALLFGLGFKEEDLDRSPNDLSGGYHLRLHLAKVLAGRPDCLLLDEPSNYLDIVSIRWFTRFLKQWKGEFILISHDREFMDSVTTHTMGIHRQKVLKIPGDTVAFYEQVLLKEEVHERTRVSLEKKRAHAQSFVDRFGAKASKAAQAQARVKMIGRMPILEKLKDLYQLSFNFNEAPFPGKKMLEAEAVDFAYDQPLIENFSLLVEKGERIAIIGKNGRGKSTLLRLLAAELQPKSGSIETADNVRLGYFGQTNIDRLHSTQTIQEEISAANPDLNFTQIRSICGIMMFSGDLAKKKISVLSGGEKSRVLLGKILAGPCNVLLLDEPTHHLDMESIEALIDALEEFEGAVIIVTHSELILKRLALDKIVICHQGRQELFLGNYDEFLEQKGWPDEISSTKPKKEIEDPKKQRAEIIQARSKALKPLEQEIAKCEEKIARLEEEVGKLTRSVQESPPQGMQDLLKTLGVRQKELDTLYQELEKITAAHEDQRAAFDKLL